MKKEIGDLIEGLSLDLAPLVREIESDPPLTFGNYGRYLSLISAHPKAYHNIVAVALIRAGASVKGVSHALAHC